MVSMTNINNNQNLRIAFLVFRIVDENTVDICIILEAY